MDQTTPDHHGLDHHDDADHHHQHSPRHDTGGTTTAEVIVSTAFGEVSAPAWMLADPRHPPKITGEARAAIRKRATILNTTFLKAVEQAIAAKELPPNTARVGRAMIQFPTSNWGYCFAGQDRIAKKLGLDLRTVQRITAKMRYLRLLARRLGGDKNTSFWVPCIDGRPLFPEASALLPRDPNRIFGVGRVPAGQAQEADFVPDNSDTKRNFVPDKNIVSYPTEMSGNPILDSLNSDSISLSLDTIGAPLTRRTRQDSLSKMPCQPIISAAQNTSEGAEALDDVADATRRSASVGRRPGVSVPAARRPEHFPEPGIAVYARMMGSTVLRGVLPDGSPAWKAGYYWYDRDGLKIYDATTITVEAEATTVVASPPVAPAMPRNRPEEPVGAPVIEPEV